MPVLGIDLGTSGCKTVLVAEDGRILASATAEYPLSTPQPLWSEQNPTDWWRGVVASVRAVLAQQPGVAVAGIGIGGQMHGATLMDAQDRVVRPAILWNDGRCQAECDLLHQRVKGLIKETGNRALVGFTAPKLLWVQRHEPTVWKQVRSVLLGGGAVLGTGAFEEAMLETESRRLWILACGDWLLAVLADVQVEPTPLLEVVRECAKQAAQMKR